MMTDEDELFASLEEVFENVDPDTVDNFSDQNVWPTAKLLKEFSRLTREVTVNREVLHPQTQGGRDRHSRRNAVWVELHTRGVL